VEELSPFIGIREGSETEPGKSDVHCEDPPVGGDEAISGIILKLLLFLYLVKGIKNGHISF
jgi:hypothetical protein